MKNRVVFLLLPFLVLICACASTGELQKLRLDMTKNEVLNQMGKPDIARGAIRNKYSQVIEVWQYKLTTQPLWGAWETNDYWLYFCDGTLVQWGEAGDWNREADRIYEVRFR